MRTWVAAVIGVSIVIAFALIIFAWSSMLGAHFIQYAKADCPSGYIKNYPLTNCRHMTLDDCLSLGVGGFYFQLQTMQVANATYEIDSTVKGIEKCIQHNNITIGLNK